MRVGEPVGAFDDTSMTMVLALARLRYFALFFAALQIDIRRRLWFGDTAVKI
jgi:hypothetical protein